MYEYDLIRLDDHFVQIYTDLFTNHWGDYPYDVTQYIPQQYANEALPYFCAAIEESSQEIVGVMGILAITESSEVGFEYPGDDWYKFSHLVVADAHRHQGLGAGIIRMAVKFLIEEAGAAGVVNHKKTNLMPHSIFLEMGFEEDFFDPDSEDEYKWRYNLITTGADMGILNQIWSQYNARV